MGGLRSTNREPQNSHTDVKYSIGNEVAKELTRITCGHEQWWRDCLRELCCAWWRKAKGEKSGQL